MRFNLACPLKSGLGSSLRLISPNAKSIFSSSPPYNASKISSSDPPGPFASKIPPLSTEAYKRFTKGKYDERVRHGCKLSERCSCRRMVRHHSGWVLSSHLPNGPPIKDKRRNEQKAPEVEPGGYRDTGCGLWEDITKHTLNTE
jgi:hypothetical protein